MIRPTFASFNTAVTALKVNQKSMDIVGQNIANINTEGYTRQRLDRSSIYQDTTNIANSNGGDVIGHGVAVNSINQQRDFSLDYRYRVAASNEGSTEVELGALGEIESVLDELITEGVGSKLSSLLTEITSLTTNPSDPIVEQVIKSNSNILSDMLNSNANQLNNIKEHQMVNLENGVIDRLNQVVSSVADLNDQIFKSNVAGNPALELNDRRNSLIDELASFINIDVIKHPVSVGPDKFVESYEIIVNDPDSPTQLLNGKEYNQLELGTAANGEITINLEMTDVDGNKTYDDITSKIHSGKIDGYLRVLNGSGGTGITSYADKGIIYYQELVDSFANEFAEAMNSSNVDADGNMNQLFMSNDGQPIRAYNIKIHDDWKNSTGQYIINTTISSIGDTSGATDNILNILAKFENDYEFRSVTDNTKVMFEGRFSEMNSYTSTSISLRTAELRALHDTASGDKFHIGDVRDSISTVDLNEEGVNLLTYSKSYNAAAKLMTTIDEMLDTLINRMGV